MKIYIAGPMTGYPRYNFQAFDFASGVLRSAGHTPVSPADIVRGMGFDPATLDNDHDWSTHPHGLDMREVFRREMLELSTCDAIAMLDGWEKSFCAPRELGVAEMLGLTRADNIIRDYLHGVTQ